MTKRQKLAHGFMRYIDIFAMRELQYEYVQEMEEKKLSANSGSDKKAKKFKTFS